MEWDKRVLGPIRDELGFEQGGVSSSDLYKIYNNDQIKDAQESGLGIPVGDLEIAAISQADDVVLLSHDVYYLDNLLQLTLDYCKKHHVTLAPEKTKLLSFSGTKQKPLVDYQMLISPITINNQPIDFVSTTEHVGIVRSTAGNLPHIQNRISSHSKALFSVLPAGLARNQNANPAASLRVEALYALSVLLSGVAALVLSDGESNTLLLHHKNTLQNLQKLHKNTPEPFIMFMAGSPSATAELHIRQLGLFGMICRLPENILHKLALSKLLTEADSSSSWFVQIRLLCIKYNLPSPLTLLYQPKTKASIKSLVKAKVVDFWEAEYRAEAASKTSLEYFKPEYLSLLQPHPLWTTCRNNSFEVNKSIVVARLMSGRYFSDWLCRHWSSDNPSGFCILCPGKNLPGTIDHMLVTCEALADKRLLLAKYLQEQTGGNSALHDAIKEIMSSSSIKNTVQFLLDPSVVPSVISAIQREVFTLDDVFSVTRTYCYALHRRRLQLIGRFNVL